MVASAINSKPFRINRFSRGPGRTGPFVIFVRPHPFLFQVHSYNGSETPFEKPILGGCGPFLPSKPLFAPSVRGPPGYPATQNLDRLVPWLEQALLRAGCVPSRPQTHARRNVARGVEVLLGTPPPRHRARPAAAAGSHDHACAVRSSVMSRMSQFSFSVHVLVYQY